MNSLRTPLMWALRIFMLTQLVVGIILWTGHGANLTGLHMAVGMLFTLTYFAIVIVAWRGGLPIGVVLAAAVLGVIVPAFGMQQTALLPGDLHWVVRVAHLLIGVAAIGAADVMLRKTAPASGATG